MWAEVKETVRAAGAGGEPRGLSKRGVRCSIGIPTVYFDRCHVLRLADFATTSSYQRMLSSNLFVRTLYINSNGLDVLSAKDRSLLTRVSDYHDTVIGFMRTKA